MPLKPTNRGLTKLSELQLSNRAFTLFPFMDTVAADFERETGTLFVIVAIVKRGCIETDTFLVTCIEVDSFFLWQTFAK